MKHFDYLKRWYSDDARLRGKVVRPRQLNFPVTDTCNARCVMCDVWKENVSDDMSVEQLREVLSQPFFQDIEHVGISGGEPFLRVDLHEVVQVFCDLPKIKSVSITSHGFNHVRHKTIGPKIVDLMKSRGVGFTMNLSIDGVGEVHDRVRGVPGGFSKLLDTIALYQEMDVPIVGQCTVSKYNLYNLSQLDSFMRKKKIDIIYRLSTSIERLSNAKTMEDVALDSRERSFFADFLSYSGVIDRTANLTRRLFYRQLVETLQNDAPRAAPCYYQNEAVLLSSRGELFQCSIVETAVCNALDTSVSEQYFSSENLNALKKTKSEVCARCPHDQTGAWSPQALAIEQLRKTSIGKQLVKFSPLAQKALVTGRSYLSPTFKPVEILKGQKFLKATLVGCYGGEHVGDAAILGGVLLRLHETYGTETVTVLSSRVDRTQGWVDMIDVPVVVDVQPYLPHETKTAIASTELLVIGGGPIMDLPALLAQHIQATKVARKMNVPVLAEGVGFGPFRRKVSLKLAKKLLKGTSSASFRTQASFDAGKGGSVASQLTTDPAFTYLKKVNHTAPQTPAWITAQSQAGRRLIAINLRPLWTRYATPEINDFDVKRIERNCLDALTGMINARPDTHFVFLPFNSDQLGMSDLNIAYMLGENGLRYDNYKVWENEPSIDELVGALRSFDGLIAMRFHACIFGISTGLPTFGIDYGIGKPSKVSELFQDTEVNGEVRDVETVTMQMMLDFLDRTNIARN